MGLASGPRHRFPAIAHTPAEEPGGVGRRAIRRERQRGSASELLKRNAEEVEGMRLFAWAGFVGAMATLVCSTLGCTEVIETETPGESEQVSPAVEIPRDKVVLPPATPAEVSVTASRIDESAEPERTPAAARRALRRQPGARPELVLRRPKQANSDDP
jgi:hypothetical protein